MEHIKATFLPLLELLTLREGWSKNFSKFTMFCLLAGASFTAYFIFKALGVMSANDMNTLAANLYHPRIFGVATLAAIYSVLGLYCSVISVAIVNAIVPKA